MSVGKRTKTSIDHMPAHNVRDTHQIKQDPTPFTKDIIPMSSEEQLQYDQAYNEKFFSPWHQSSVELTEDEMKWQFKYAKQRTYRRNGKRISKSWYKYQIKNSNFKMANTLNRPAITVRHTNLLLFPSKLGIYYDPRKTGEGFPFDYNQNSAVYLNTPLMISHYSLDKKWVYAKTSYASGWINIKDIAFVSPDFQEKFENGNYAITVKDNLQLKDNAHYISLVKMGTIFPIDPISQKYLIGKRDKNGYAKLTKVTVKDLDIIAYKPIKFNAYNIAYISKQLVNEPYGWGGKEKCRDCSALTRDFFAPFGIYLPRNSTQQANAAPEFISLEDLDSYNKKQTILDNAKPFRSLLFVPGHITLYLGEKNGEPIILHNYWGVRLKDNSKRVMGRAIITTTQPGAELKNVKKESMLINTLTGIASF